MSKVLWNGMCTAEKAWHRTNGRDKHKLRADFVQKRRELDKQVQRAKREYWYQQQRDLLSMNSNDPKSFWKKIGHISVGNERKQPVPEEVIYEDGSVSKDSNDVLKKWQNDFSNLLNVNSVTEDFNNEQIGDNLYSNNVDPQVIESHGIDNINAPIDRNEVLWAIKNAYNGKARGGDDIPVEALRNDSCFEFLVILFNRCFNSGKILDIWQTSIINPIPKCALEYHWVTGE